MFVEAISFYALCCVHTFYPILVCPGFFIVLMAYFNDERKLP